MAQSFVKCEICEKRECKLICTDCDQYFCQECKEGHIKTKTTKDHQFLDSGTFQPQFKKLRCTQHEQHFIFFCARCQTLVCPVCLPENHQEHRMLKIDEVASMKKNVLNETIKKFVTKLNEFQEEVNSIKTTQENCQRENIDVIQHVDEQAKHISNVLENQRRCIIASVKQKAKTEEERIAIIVEDLQHCIKEAKELERKVKLDLHGSDTSIVSNFQLSKSKIDTFEFQDTSISTCPVQFAKYNVPKEELSLLKSVFSGNLSGWSAHEERKTLKSMMSKHDMNIEELQKELTNQIQIRQKCEEELKRKDEEIRALKSSISGKMKTNQLNKACKDLDSLQQSMSSEKLTKGNPGITDLGDPNRPMKISERYGELYDNEWTDAMIRVELIKPHFPDLEKTELDEIILRHLYRTLMFCYQECKRISLRQTKTIRQTIAKSLSLHIDSSEHTETNLPGWKEISFYRKHHGDDFATSLITTSTSQKLCEDILKDWQYSRKSGMFMEELLKTPFFEKCVNLCWYMAIQEPMMYLDDKLQIDTRYNKTEYKEYVQSGDKVRYIVWPALYLHEKGPLLYKGVVQAYF